MKLFNRLALYTGVVAVIVGLVAVINRDLFFEIPKVGFVLYAATGGSMPPHFDWTPFRQEFFGEWIRDGDVVVSAAPKSGTTWLCYCSDAIRRKGDDSIGLPYTDLLYTTPWPELKQGPGNTWADRKEQYNTKVLPDNTRLKDYWDNPAFPFRVFKSHVLPFRAGGFVEEVVPVKAFPNVKFVSAVRDPLEIAESFYAMLTNFNMDFMRDFGGMDAVLPTDREEVVKAMLPGGLLYSGGLPFVKSWWEHRHEPNVLLLHYNDMRRNLTGLVDKLAAFYGIELTEKEAEKVREKCSFQHMKQHSGLFDLRMPLHTKRPGSTLLKPASFINKGEVGKKASVSPELAQEFRAAEEKVFADPELIHWAREGGSF